MAALDWIGGGVPRTMAFGVEKNRFLLLCCAYYIFPFFVVTCLVFISMLDEKWVESERDGEFRVITPGNHGPEHVKVHDP